MTDTARCIAVDWGITNLRATLLGSSGLLSTPTLAPPTTYAPSPATASTSNRAHRPRTRAKAVRCRRSRKHLRGS